jgi:amino acid permease
VLVFLNCFGSAAASLVVIGGLMPSVVFDLVQRLDVTQAELERHRRLWISLVLILVFPMCLLRSLNKLKFTGVCSAVAIAYSVVLSLVYLADPGLDACAFYGGYDSSDIRAFSSPCAKDITPFSPRGSGLSALAAIPIFLFASSVNFQARLGRAL